MNDQQAIELFKNLNLDVNHIVQSDTHAEFLNKAFDKNYKGWGKSYWFVPFSDKQMIVWMVTINGEKHGKWVNYYAENEDLIVEIYNGNDAIFDGKNILNFNKENPYRIAVEITNQLGQRYYKIKGVYKFQFDESNINKHILRKIY